MGTLADNLNDSNQTKLAKHFWEKNSEDGLKLRADFLLSYSLVSRGSNIRNLKISEIGHVEFPKEGVAGAHLLRTVWRKSKKNQYGKFEQNGALRHEDVTRCSIGALSFLFFYRWHIREDVWPDFSEASRWYNFYVFPLATNAERPMTYTKQYENIKEAQEALGIQTSVKTQSGRKTGASFAENNGASEASVDKQGHWATRSRSGAYANNVVAWECVRALAGFPVEPKNYYLSRALLNPPTELQKMIFPHAEASLEQIEKSISENRPTEIAGKSFISLIMHMRIVICQDAALLLLNDDYKKHPIFEHAVFASDLFRTYAASLIEKINATPPPQSLLLEQAFPIVARSLSRIESQSVSHSQDLGRFSSSADNRLDRIEEKLDLFRSSAESRHYEYRQRVKMI